MNIEVSEQTEKVIRTAVQSGRFDTAEAFLEAAAQAFIEKVNVTGETNKPSADELKQRFKPFRGKLKMSREEIIEARHHGLP